MGKVLKIPAEIYSRVVGYYRPVQQWNKGKQQEFAHRKEQNVNNIELNLECVE